MNSIVDAHLLPHENDGLILTKKNYPYLPGRNRGILKWKPNELNTVDFFAADNTEYYALSYPEIFAEDNLFVLELYTVFADYYFFFDFLLLNSEDDYANFMAKQRYIGKHQFYGNIIECNYDHTLESHKINWFYEVLYKHDSESLASIVDKCKLKAEWTAKQKAKQVEAEVPLRGENDE